MAMLDTLENVKLRLGITTSADDVFLTNQITVISDTIEMYCARKFLVANWEQTFYAGDFPRRPNVEMYHYPVNSIASIIVDGVTRDLSQYRLNKPTGYITSVCSSFPEGKEMVITYNAGLASTPTPVLDVLDSLVSQRYNKKKAGVDLNFGSDVQRVSIPGAIAIDFDYSLSSNERESTFGSILGNFTNVLDMYSTDRAVINSSTLKYVETSP